MFLDKASKILILSLFLISITVVSNQYIAPDFLIGAGSSAYQTEGAWNEDGKSESWWDYAIHSYPEKVKDFSNGDIACDSYHKYKEDISIVEHLGFTHYRFSISWPRVLPYGHRQFVNQAGVNYYHNVLDELRNKQIIPVVTIYHWDHPYVLEQLGGWLNRAMIDYFFDYAYFIFQEFGAKVPIFTTINEPYIYCLQRYVLFSSLDNDNGKNAEANQYRCLYHLLLAHAKVYHLYDQSYRGRFHGKIGIVIPIHMYYGEPYAVEAAIGFMSGMSTDPIFSETGDWPAIVVDHVCKRSAAQGQSCSRLPRFTETEITYIKGTSDYFGLNYYTAYNVTMNPDPNRANWVNDAGTNETHDERLPKTESFWLRPYPQGLRDILRRIKNLYNNPAVYIMENGVSDPDGIDDRLRTFYLYSHLRETLLAKYQDGCNVKAYTIWTLMDNFEWLSGYTNHFGIVRVNFTDSNRKRDLKASAYYMRDVIAGQQLKLPW